MTGWLNFDIQVQSSHRSHYKIKERGRRRVEPLSDWSLIIESLACPVLPRGSLFSQMRSSFSKSALPAGHFRQCLPKFPGRRFSKRCRNRLCTFPVHWFASVLSAGIFAIFVLTFLLDQARLAPWRRRKKKLRMEKKEEEEKEMMNKWMNEWMNEYFTCPVSEWAQSAPRQELGSVQSTVTAHVWSTVAMYVDPAVISINDNL